MFWWIGLHDTELQLLVGGIFVQEVGAVVVVQKLNERKIFVNKVFVGPNAF
ncbi:MAG: hypothetical protein H6559_37440 [Lewinellaceae bacterium]|nr:hypothetical protein [Lewinellaceae bacterium]